MATGIAQKNYTALFPLWSLRKNDISKIKYIHRNSYMIERGNIESIEKNFKYLNVEKKTTKSILILIML